MPGADVSGEDATENVLAFAHYASRAGWTNAALERFVRQRGIAAEDARSMWPRGVRDLGRALNALADAKTSAAFGHAPPAAMRDILLARFTQNADLKPAVASLARSDLWHPIDTLARTEATARLMWRCYGRPGRGGPIDRWLLVFAYSLCAIAWLADRSPDLRLTRRVASMALAVIGVG